MDELVKMVSQKVGISEDQAKQAVNVVVNFIKERLPAPIASQVDNVINNPGVAGAIGGLFGKK
jgi:nucleoid DNA-binding protein